MEFYPSHFYHVYNRGNNRQPIFFENENYDYFLRKLAKAITPFADILAYCLMPNHFHFLIFTNSIEDLEPVASRSDPMNSSHRITGLSTGIGVCLRSYTRAINKRHQTVGSLFQQRTKAKRLDDEFYPLTCFHYIHQNPLKAKLVKLMEDWPYSSFTEYLSPLRNGICNQGLAEKLLEIDDQSFYENSMKAIDPDKIGKLY